MRKVYLILMLTFSAFSLAQENGKISGRVIDARTKEPLAGVNVVLIGRGTGSASDVEGKFLIDGLANGSYQLEVSYIGYVTEIKTDIIVKNV
ncbi:MAG: carboxypeptidase-like regulatory domain-containing protein, partial [Planctomycetota bacterium]